MSNQIFIIKPYLWEGIWVFDDPNVGLLKEALVAGVPEIIKKVTEEQGISNPENGFLCLFSEDPFPDHHVCLEWIREDKTEGQSGNVYRYGNQEGWLCPALFKYFDHTPKKLYIQVKAAPIFDPQKEFEEWWESILGKCNTSYQDTFIAGFEKGLQKGAVPAGERWLHENKEALKSVLRGLKQAREGQIVEGPDEAKTEALLREMDEWDGEEKNSP